MKVCFSCSGGGHLTQLLQLKRILKKYDSFILTFSNPGSAGRVTKSLRGRHKIYFTVNPVSESGFRRLILRYLINLLESFLILREKNPDVIITNGSGFSLGCILSGKLLGKKIIFIETFSRINKPSNFGKVATIFADITVVQWRPLLNHYPNSIYGGPIFDFNSKIIDSKNNMKNHIFLVLGTRSEDFSRLLKQVDNLVKKGIIKSKVIVQKGHTKSQVRYMQSFDFCSRKEFESYIQGSSIVINGNGIGTISMAIRYNKPIVLVPRLRELGEIDIDNLDIAHEFHKLGLVKTVFDMNKLENSILTAKEPEIGNFDDESMLEDIIEDKISKWF